MSAVKLRPYQLQALAAEDAHRAEHPDQNRLLISLATGLGKTIVFAERIRRFLEEAHQTGGVSRVLVLVHTDELVQQAVEKVGLILHSGDMPWSIGVVKAERNEYDADVVVASVQTLARPGRKDYLSDVGYIVVDEAHHATARTYVEILEHFGAMPSHACPEFPCWDCRGAGFTDPPVPVLGVTATPERTDGTGLGSIWHNLVFSRSTSWAMRKGYLVDLVPYTIRIPDIDATAPDARLDAALVDSLAPETVVRAWAEKVWGYCRECADASEQVRDDVGHTVLPSYCPNEQCPVGQAPPSTVLFAPGVASARQFAYAFQDAGIKAEVIHGGTAPAARRAILDRYEAGITTVLCNAMVLTEGWDSPRTKCVIVARPTKSVPLFVQMVGRGLRPWLAAEAPPREEQRCVLLSIADAVNSLASAADLSDKLSEAQDGKSVLAMEDEWDIGQGIEDRPQQYVGPVRVEAWDEMVQRSTKAWKYTAGGVPFLPTAKRGQGYVFIVEQREVGAHDRGWKVWARMPATPGEGRGDFRTAMLCTAPDLELAMSLAEDEAQELGGDIGALLADKTRAWRKGVPSQEMQDQARRVGVPESDTARILGSKAAGKAGKLSDLIDKVTASRILDVTAAKIRERAKA